MPGIDLGLTDTWDAAVEGIGVGERVLGGATGVSNRPLKQLGNRTEFLRNRTLSALALTAVPLPLGPAAYNASARWEQNSSGYWEQTDVSGTSPMFIWVPMPRFGTIQKVRFFVKHSGSHSALPATMPTFGLKVCRFSSPEPLVSLVTVTDPSATVGDYDALHTVESATISAPTATFDEGYIYQVTLSGELGANSLAGLRVYGAQIDVVPG